MLEEDEETRISVFSFAILWEVRYTARMKHIIIMQDVLNSDELRRVKHTSYAEACYDEIKGPSLTFLWSYIGILH